MFRKEALERISSPEQLTDYLHVTNPGVWAVLVAVRGHPLDFLAPDLWTCAYFKDGWKARKDELLRGIGRL